MRSLAKMVPFTLVGSDHEICRRLTRPVLHVTLIDLSSVAWPYVKKALQVAGVSCIKLKPWPTFKNVAIKPSQLYIAVLFGYSIELLFFFKLCHENILFDIYLAFSKSCLAWSPSATYLLAIRFHKYWLYFLETTFSSGNIFKIFSNQPTFNATFESYHSST